jgi:hypothetical protein
MQQYITILSVADYGDGSRIIKDDFKLSDTINYNQQNHPWVMYYVKYLDTWQTGCDFKYLIDVESRVSLTEIREDLYSFRPNKKVIKAIDWGLKYYRKGIGSEERKWYLYNLRNAICSFNTVFKKRKIYVFRKVISTSFSDGELKEMIKQTN